MRWSSDLHEMPIICKPTTRFVEYPELSYRQTSSDALPVGSGNANWYSTEPFGSGSDAPPTGRERRPEYP